MYSCFIVVTVLWVFSVCLHEFGHALAAYHGGDYTVRDKGYLTLNPLRYTHPVYSLLMPVIFMMLGGIGLPGGAVYIERSLIRSRAWDTLVSLAGPLMNVVLVLGIGLCFRTGLIENDTANLASVSMAFLLVLQVSAIILNLIPVPPLDGFQAIAPWLPINVRERMFAFSRQGIWLVFIALWFIDPLNNAFWHLVYGITNALGVDTQTALSGYQAFQFWEHRR